MKIYLASSWRNKFQPNALVTLRNAGYKVYDFRNPAIGNHGFSWAKIDQGWMQWTPAQFRDALRNFDVGQGFRADWQAMEWAEVFVLLLPCGKSAHLELGWAVGAGKPTIIWMPERSEPELMYKMVDHICLTSKEVLEALEAV